MARPVRPLRARARPAPATQEGTAPKGLRAGPRPQLRRRPPPVRLRARLRSVLGSADVVRQSLVSLTLNSSTSFIAGAVLGSITHTFERFPGLLVLVPAAIGLRGNVFSAL